MPSETGWDVGALQKRNVDARLAMNSGSAERGAGVPAHALARLRPSGDRGAC
jgi:hypothetical protein